MFVRIVNKFVHLPEIRKMAVQAVLTGDIVNSTKLSKARELKLTSCLTGLFIEFDSKLEFYRGDSFQAYVKNPANALRLALLSRTAAIKLFKNWLIKFVILFF